MKPRFLLRLLPWLLLGFIVFATLSSLEMRPRISHSAHFERFAAFWLLGFLFAAFHPRRIGTVLLFVAGVAVGLELVQLVSADRHARLGDLLVKIAGGVCGVLSCWLTLRVLPGFRGLLARMI
ncbi:VanZ family protein [Bosea sp. (in: a-proteobacteria)]|uniref:VanZ family protein n=1 Tax=Bosea sp. (in: a-proteobacteria) TaxID=1871050 RepID=UPI001AD3AD7E|nr:VanZ family protein [Bosea sp. (in: a-proteobacteria)]MBN9436374.1 VanZ family protein [Bosea sp. (in: a-proteobacteria)]